MEEKQKIEIEKIQEILNSTLHYSNSRPLRLKNFSSLLQQEPKTFEDRIKAAQARMQETRADNDATDLRLKKIISAVIIGVLIVQTILIFYIAISQAIGTLVWFVWPIEFELSDWDFRLLIAGTLIETYYLMRIVVTYLFPRREQSKG